MKYFFVFFLALCVGSVRAQALPTYVGGATGGTLIPGGLSTIGDGYRTVAANTNIAGVTNIADKVRIGIGAANADMFVVRSLTLSNALAVGGRLIPLLGTAAAVYSLYDAFRCHYDGTSSLFKCDPGRDPGNFLFSNGIASGFASGDLACRDWFTRQGGTAMGWTYVGYYAAQFTCQVKSGGSLINTGNISKYPNPAYVPCTIGLDGKCAAGSTVSQTVEQVASTIATNSDSAIQSQALAAAIAAVKQALNNKVDLSPYADKQPATGPSSVTQPLTTKTVTAANGTSQVQTTQVTNNITYAGDTYSITNTTNITNPDGSTEKVQETPKKDACEQYPNTVGCMNVGDLPTDSPTWQTKTVNYQAENLGFTGSCPAPWSGTVHGWNLSMSWQPACDVAPQIRLGVLALCTLGALLMISTTVRT